MPMSPSLEWNDLHDLLCVVEAGSLSAAARQLGVSQSTMSRRIAALEARGLNVFEGDRAELALNALGEELVAAARAMRRAFASAEAAVVASPPAIRMAACEMTARLFVADAVADWTRRSGQAVDLGVFDDLFVLKPADFDVMVMPLTALPSALRGIHIATVDWGLYASSLYLGNRPGASNQRDLEGHDVIRASGSLARIEAYRWLSAQGGTTALLASSPLAQHEACTRGQGIALLPRRLADEDDRLVRIEREVPPPIQIWIVADPANATHPRVASFLRWAASRFPKAAAPSSPTARATPSHWSTSSTEPAESMGSSTC